MSDYNNDYTYYYQDPRLIAAQQQVDASTQVQPAAQPSPVKSWVNVTDSRYLKGFAVGAAVAFAASNPTVQKAVVSGSVKLWTALQGGIEEAKEKLQDIKAEVNHSE
ncbi:hypothetical protein [Maridesulfovibrio zosterae]|uniref:hypothetical protein n=1 Tax=Maridesulfovibrio zosterae TaxID=82171 RepID=UPI000425D737|nr:hypothetical protein [Maridesulfovibrio zosterae]